MQIRAFMLLAMLLAGPAQAATTSDEGRYTLTVASGIISPPSFDFDWGYGELIAVGYMPVPGAGLELELMRMRQPSNSDVGFNLDLDVLPAAGPSAFEARTATLSLFLSGGITPRTFYRFRLGFSGGDYRMTRPAQVEESRIWGLSFGAGMGYRLTEQLYVVMDGNRQSHLVESGTLGLMWLW